MKQTHNSNVNLPIYLDYAATSPVDERVVETMLKYMSSANVFGNPASRSHSFGWQAEEAVDLAREQVAALVNCDPKEIVWTSGATESDNLAIKGIVDFYGASKGRHIITSSIEHKAVLDSVRELERQGCTVTKIDPLPSGQISPQAVADAIRDDTCLVSIMHVNNEMGTYNDIEAIGTICREASVWFHVDAAQSAGKIAIDLKQLPVDLMSFSAHKLYGPKGIGALYVSRSRPRVRLSAIIHGGGHERGMRSGTLPTHQIAGMGKAFELARENFDADSEHVQLLNKTLWSIVEPMEAIRRNGDKEVTVPNILNVSFQFIEGESLLMALRDLALSSGSACTSASLEPSYVLRALGLNDEMAHSSLRFSFGRMTKLHEIEYAGSIIQHAVSKLRELSPLWEMHKEGINLDEIEWAAH